jgi:2-haloalkanoic acid dehalogenase type II
MTFPYKALTFDCFGTLMDWRRGQRDSLWNLPECAPVRAEGVEAFATLDRERMLAEQELQRGPFLPYGQVLQRSLASAGKRHGIDFAPSSLQSYAAAMAQWPAFADSAEGLEQLSVHAQIGLLSNCEEDILRQVASQQLGCPQAICLSADAVQSYKPAPGHWQAFLDQSSLKPEEILHVSAYDHYDLRPAQALGFPVAFIARDQERLPDDLNVEHQAEDILDLVLQLGLGA